MNGLNGKPTEYPENALVPYPVIAIANKHIFEKNLVSF